MKSVIKLSFILSVFFSAQTMAAANPVEFWGCKFNDGMGMDDLMEWTEEWGEVVDDLPDDGYNAWVMTPMFKSNMTDLDFLVGGRMARLRAHGLRSGRLLQQREWQCDIREVRRDQHLPDP